MRGLRGVRCSGTALPPRAGSGSGGGRCCEKSSTLFLGIIVAVPGRKHLHLTRLRFNALAPKKKTMGCMSSCTP